MCDESKMQKSAYDVLLERGFIEQLTHEHEIKELLKNEKISFYIGFDPTADSLHIGHFLTVMAMAHMQRAGHRPIALMGGGTGMVGDPTDRSDMRKMMTKEEVAHNVMCFKNQMSRWIDFSEDKAILANNADWLMKLSYVDFIREYGVHFSVNKMLTADTYRTRFERGLSFFELNYMVMQSYDFLALFRQFGCVMQLGGNDQWSNIIGGVELIRKCEGKPAFGMTLTLLTTSEGKKMGKTQNGAIWLDAKKTSPYDFYQYWRNVDDAEVKKCLALLTFLPMEEVNRLGALKDEKINTAKEILAFEVTQIVHGYEEAQKAQNTARSLFSDDKEACAPVVSLPKKEFENGMNILELLVKANLVASKSEAKRLIIQGGITIEKNKILDVDYMVTIGEFQKEQILIQKGKKTFISIKME